MKIATAVRAFEVDIAPHNFYGHLCTMINALLELPRQIAYCLGEGH
jgi:hypothetical protein